MKREGIIIGAGASGLASAIFATEAGAHITVLDHMPRPGKKLLLTGNGKCNLTNMKIDESAYRCSDRAFPIKALKKFGPGDTIDFFRRLGIVTYQKDGYVYPMSDQAKSVLEALEEKARELHVKILCETEIEKINTEGRKFSFVTSSGEMKSDFLILAAGSAAYPKTGSDGSGYEIAACFGHTVVEPLPALVPLKCRENILKTAAGVRCTAEVSIYADDRHLCSDTGELQITEEGISGIPVFQVSRFASCAVYRRRNVTASVDFMPSVSEKDLISSLCYQKKILSGRNGGGYLTGMFNKKLADILIKRAGIRPDSPVSAISTEQISKLSRQIKHFKLTISEPFSFDRAQACCGGVDVREIDPNTFESRKQKGLYFAGEILDVDGICGGYNLQWAWTSAFIAGKSAAANI